MIQVRPSQVLAAYLLGYRSEPGEDSGGLAWPKGAGAKPVTVKPEEKAEAASSSSLPPRKRGKLPKKENADKEEKADEEEKAADNEEKADKVRKKRTKKKEAADTAEPGEENEEPGEEEEDGDAGFEQLFDQDVRQTAAELESDGGGGGGKDDIGDDMSIKSHLSSSEASDAGEQFLSKEEMEEAASRARLTAKRKWTVDKSSLKRLNKHLMSCDPQEYKEQMWDHFKKVQRQDIVDTDVEVCGTDHGTCVEFLDFVGKLKFSDASNRAFLAKFFIEQLHRDNKIKQTCDFYEEDFSAPSISSKSNKKGKATKSTKKRVRGLLFRTASDRLQQVLQTELEILQVNARSDDKASVTLGSRTILQALNR